MKYPVHSKFMLTALKRLDITQQQMADKLGWNSSQYVSAICCGKSRIPPASFKFFSTLSGVNLSQLITSYLHYEREQVLKKAGVKHV